MEGRGWGGQFELQEPEFKLCHGPETLIQEEGDIPCRFLP